MNTNSELWKCPECQTIGSASIEAPLLVCPVCGTNLVMEITTDSWDNHPSSNMVGDDEAPEYCQKKKKATKKGES